MAGKSGKKYGLILTKKPSSVKIKPSIFGDDDSDNNEDSGRKNVNSTIRKEAEKKKQMRQTQLEIDKVLEEDPTVYDYDAVYDKMAERKANLLAAKTATADRKPKYISNLLKFAEARKKNEERRIERQVQKEREADGDKFDDKDAFVTSAYRQKMQEMAEDEERQRKRDERDGDVTKQSDLSKFYRNLLDKNVSTGGAFDTEQHTKAHEDNTKKSRRSPSGEKKEENKKGKTSENERRHYRQGEDETSRQRYEDKAQKTYQETEENEPRREADEAREKRTREHEERERKHDEKHHDKPGHEEIKHDEERHETMDENEKLETEKQNTRKRSNDDEASSSKDLESSENTEIEKSESARKEEKSKVNKFAKHSSTETVMSAKERYLARKKTRVVVVQADSDDEN